MEAILIAVVAVVAIVAVMAVVAVMTAVTVAVVVGEGRRGKQGDQDKEQSFFLVGIVAGRLPAVWGRLHLYRRAGPTSATPFGVARGGSTTRD